MIKKTEKSIFTPGTERSCLVQLPDGCWVRPQDILLIDWAVGTPRTEEEETPYYVRVVLFSGGGPEQTCKWCKCASEEEACRKRDELAQKVIRGES